MLIFKVNFIYFSFIFRLTSANPVIIALATRRLFDMGIKIDIDKVLTQNDFILFYESNRLRWPWKETHFILSKYCYGCKKTVAMTNSRLTHFFLPMTRQDVKFLLKSPYFWCTYCDFSVYDHYPTDECQYCLN